MERLHAAEADLLTIVRNYKLAVDRPTIEEAVGTADGLESVSTWVREYLGPETLLSQEEVALCSTLEQSGVSRRIAGSHDLSLIQPSVDHEIRDALQSLEASTAAIESHTKQIAEQRGALVAFQERNGRMQGQRDRIAVLDHKRRLHMKQGTELANEELLHSLSDRSAAVQRHLKGTTSRIPGTIRTTLEEDDKEFSKTEHHAALLTQLNQNEVDSSKIKRFCGELVDRASEEVRHRLQRVYLEFLCEAHELSEDFPTSEDDQGSQLKSELDSLYTEIADMSQMLVSQEYLTPLMESETLLNIKQHDQACHALDKIERRLKYNLEKAKSIATQCRHLDAHVVAINALSAHFAEILGVKDGKLLAMDNIKSRPSFSLDAADNAVRSTSNLLPGDKEPQASDKEPEVAEHRQLLNMLGMRQCPEDHRELQASLNAASNDISIKTTDVAQNVQTSIRKRVAVDLGSTATLQGLLLNALLSEMNTGVVRMTNADLEARKGLLETIVGNIGSYLGGVDVGSAHEASSKERDSFVGRWTENDWGQSNSPLHDLTISRPHDLTLATCGFLMETSLARDCRIKLGDTVDNTSSAHQQPNTSSEESHLASTKVNCLWLRRLLGKMPTHRSRYRQLLAFLAFGAQIASATPWTPIVVKDVTELGAQLSPGVTDVSRDGGYTALINSNIVWLYDDTECFDREGKQLSFVSNTAAYSKSPYKNVSTVTDFGVVNVGKDKNGKAKLAILADTTVGTGGWIPFQDDELAFNTQKKGQERVAIWPGTSPTSISTTQAFLYAPLVYVDNKPQDPTKEYQARGMTMIAITASDSGPTATRKGDLIIPGTEVAFGGFSSLLGFKSTGSTQDGKGDRDVYLLGVTNAGLQLARAGMNDLNTYSKYTFYNPEALKFSSTSPDPNLKDAKKIYLPGSFSSGSVFYSPYFNTFVMIYFNNMVDSTFYMRYLDLNKPLGADGTWVTGGKNGKGIVPEDAESLVNYAWSSEQKLWASPTSKGGFNYAGMAHPEFFNRQYFAPSLYPDGTSQNRRVNDWYGGDLISERDAGSDGKNMLLSWTGQLRGGLNSGIYQVQLAMLAFEDIPSNPTGSSSSLPASPTHSSSASSTKHGHKPINTAYNMIEKGKGSRISFFFGSYKYASRGLSALLGSAVSLLGIFGIGFLGT